MFADAIAQVYDSIVTAELPLRLQLQYLLEREYPCLKQSQNFACKIPSSQDMVSHANQSAVVKNIHSSNHTDSCVNKFLPYCRLFGIILKYNTINLCRHSRVPCRYCKGSVLSPVTGGCIVTPIDLGKDNIPRYKFETSPIPEPPPFQHKTYAAPVPNIDCRAISFEIRRRSLRLQNDFENLVLILT